MWRVILADDERYILTGLRSLIDWQSLGCEVVCEAANGQELLRKIAEHGADIVVLDIRMPGMDGLEAAEQLRRDHPELTLIFLTGYEDFRYARAAVNLGASAYIVKTEVLEELPAALKRATEALGRRRAAPEPPAMIALLRSLCDGTFAIRSKEESFAAAHARLCAGFSEGCLLAAEFGQAPEPAGMETLSRLLENGFARFAPALFPMSDTRLCLLLCRADEPTPAIAAACEPLLSAVESFCGLRAAIAVSARFSAIEDMRAAYAEADGLLGHRLHDGEKQVCFTRERESGTDAAPALGGLPALLARGDAKEMEDWLDAFLNAARGLDLIAARSLCLRALGDMEALCRRHDRPLAAAAEWSAAILTARTLSALRGVLLEALRETAVVVGRENEKIHALIKATDAYVAAHFCERITLRGIAAAVHANPSHVSRFYKEKTGRNLFGVINALRVERAKALMRTTDLRTYEIADAVGFSDTSNFSKFFKKHTGLSPREYARREGRNLP